MSYVIFEDVASGNLYEGMVYGPRRQTALEKAKTKLTFLGSEVSVDGVTLENLSKINNKLYNRLLYLKRRMVSVLGSDVTYDDVMYMLDLDEGLVKFKNVSEIFGFTGHH